MKKMSILITAVVVIAAAVIIVPRFIGPTEEVAAAAIPVVALEKPQIGNIELYTELTGSIEPADIAYVIPKVAGEVTETYVTVGDYVQEGQRLLHIDTKQVDSAKIAMDTAAVSLQDANTSLQRMTVLYQSGDISKQDFEQVQSSAKLAKLQYDSAKLNYDNQIEFSTITAPISGLVESFDVEVHNNVSQSNVLCVISGEGIKAVSFNVTERVMNGLSTGDAVQIEKNGTEYEGVITELSTMVDAASGLFKVKASLDSSDSLPTGSQVKLYVTSERAENTLLVPTDAVYYEGGQAMVYLHEDGEVRETRVSVGIYDSDYSEITEGLDLDDDVIVTWSAELFEGAKVTVYNPTEAASTETVEETAAEETAN